jgi:hypothetical protein
VRRENPSPAQDRILRAIAASTRKDGLRSRELETALGMTTGEIRMATKWLAEGDYLKGTKRIVRFDFGPQGIAKKPLMFWTLTDKGRERVAQAASADSSQ